MIAAVVLVVGFSDDKLIGSITNMDVVHCVGCFTVESLTMRCAEESKDPHVSKCLYNYYMLTEQMDKVRQLVQVCCDISVTTSLFDMVTANQ